jgi:hypothetical protein
MLQKWKGQQPPPPPSERVKGAGIFLKRYFSVATLIATGNCFAIIITKVGSRKKFPFSSTPMSLLFLFYRHVDTNIKMDIEMDTETEMTESQTPTQITTVSEFHQLLKLYVFLLAIGMLLKY